MYLFLAQGDEIFRFSSGAVHQTIYFPEAKALPVDEEAIVREAREDWHSEKMNIPRHKFFDAVTLLKKKQVIPTGGGKLVREKYLL